MFAFSLAHLKAICLPIPRDAPVMKIVLPAKDLATRRVLSKEIRSRVTYGMVTDECGMKQGLDNLKREKIGIHRNRSRNCV